MDIPITVHNDKKEENEHQDNQKSEQESNNEPPKPEQEHDNNDGSHEDHDHDHSDEKGNSKTGIIAIVVIIIIVAVFLVLRSQNAQDLVSDVSDSVRDAVGTEEQMSETAMLMKDSAPGADAKAIEIQNAWIANIADIEFKNAGSLTDVSGGTATGVAGSDVIDGIYHLYVAFENLPALEEGFFYEGWIVRKEPLSVMSTGALEDYNSSLVNAYLSRENLSDHTTYILTLEPDDGDPAPAAHVLEGEITPKQ